MLIKIASGADGVLQRVEPGADEAAPAAAPAAPVWRTAATSQRGYFDEIAKGVAKGWAFDERQPATRLTIEFWCGDVLIGSGLADSERLDVKAHGLGDGRHGFQIPLPQLDRVEAPATITARIAGSGTVLGDVEFKRSPRGRLRGTIEAASGRTLNAQLVAESEFTQVLTVDVLVDGRKVGEIEVPPLQKGERFAASAALPASVLDGVAHWFRLAAADTQAPIADEVLTTSFVATPEDALQSYAQKFPGFLSANAQRRYAALEGQIAGAARALARQAPGSGALSLAAYVEQLAHVHAQVARGVAEPAGTPARLVALAYDAPRVSVVVPVHDRFGVTYNCLAALLLAPNEATFEIIVVDDGSSDRTRQLPELTRNVTVIRNEVAQGFVKSCNLGAKAARGDYVVMLNNDTEPGPGWLDELLHVFENFADVGLAGGKLIYANGQLQEAGGGVSSHFDVWNYGRLGNPRDPRYNYTRQVDYVSGACLMLPRAVWDKLGGFDEIFAPAYYEDNDLAFRVRALGLKTYYTPFAEIVHFEGLTNGVSLEEGVKRHQAINEPKFRQRWARTVRQLPHGADPELAKDRGVTLRALVIDYQTPQPDKDAGSYAAVQEMRLLQALGFKLTFAPRNLAYLGNYTEDLQRMGVECLFAPFQTSIEEVIGQRGGEFDIVYVTRYAVAEAFLDTIREAAPRARIVFCNADLHFLREIRAALVSGDSDGLAKAKETREAELGVMRRVDVTLSYSDAEAAVIVSHNLDASKVARCPWVVEVRDAPPPFAARAGLAFLGGFQHPPNEEAVRFFLRDIMPELRRRLPGVKLHIYGAQMGESLRQLAADDVVVEGYVARVEAAYDRHRLFVAPLRSGAGLKGKVVGALAAGAPTILTTLAAEGIGLSRGVEAVVADSPAEWVEAVAALYGDEARWTQMSARAQAFARENFSFARGVETMRAALALAGVYAG